MKIALITTTNLNVITGRDNNVRTRIRYLSKIKDIDLDVYLFRHQDDFLLRLLKRRKKQYKTDSENIDGVNCKNLWLNYSFIDALFTYVLKLKDMICRKQLELLVPSFSKYDIILAHTLEGKYIAYNVKMRYAIPYINGWHGSDINIIPYRSKKIFELHKKIIANADFNLFVSKALLIKSNEIVDSNNKGVSYSGISPNFTNYDSITKQNLKSKYQLNNRYVIGFVGRLLPIKNVFILPKIFKKLQENIEDVSFVIVGDGELANRLQNAMKKNAINRCHFLGKIDPKEMPKIMNCLDVLILPSLNEGLPLVTIEAMACGVNVVGSKVGGTPEAIGEKNVFAIDANFVENISNRIIDILRKGKSLPSISNEFSWDKTIDDVVSKCKEIVYKKHNK